MQLNMSLSTYLKNFRNLNSLSLTKSVLDKLPPNLSEAEKIVLKTILSGAARISTEIGKRSY